VLPARPLLGVTLFTWQGVHMLYTAGGCCESQQSATHVAIDADHRQLAKTLNPRRSHKPQALPHLCSWCRAG
jgi:hypothetical protein